MIKYVTLDLWLTLIKSHPEYKRRRAERTQQLIHEFYGKLIHIAKVTAAIRSIDLWHNNFMQSMGLHRVKPPEMWSLALTMLGIEEYTKEQIHSFVNQAEHLFFDYPPVLIEDDLFQTLNTLEGMGIKMNIISNTGFITANVLKATKVVNEITSFVHHLFASDIEGIAKPNKSIFQAAQTFEIDITSSYLHVGDNLIADIQGAKNAGFHTLLYGPGRELTKLSHLPEYIKNFNDAVKCTPNPRRGESTIQ